MRIEIFIVFLSALAVLLLYKRRELKKDLAGVVPYEEEAVLYADSFQQHAA
jgi:hypothetical protein